MPRTATSTNQSSPSTDGIAVTVENFTRAESDMYFSNMLKRPDASIGKFTHNRVPTPIDQQEVIRMNRDTLYSAAVFDLDGGPVKIDLPDAGKRFMSMQVVNEDQYTLMVVYGKGSYPLTKEKTGTRYVMTIVRILADPNDPSDLDQVRKLQDAIKVSQNSTGTFDIPKWDKESHDKVRSALLVLGSTLPDTRHAFGAKGEVDPVRFLIA